MRKSAVLVVVGLLAALAAVLPPSVTAAPWAPGLGTSWQIQFSGQLNTNVAADAYDLDTLSQIGITSIGVPAFTAS